MSEYHQPRNITRRARQDAFKEAYLQNGRNAAAATTALGMYVYAPFRWAEKDEDFKAWWDAQQAIKAQEFEAARDYYLQCFMVSFLKHGLHVAHASVEIGVGIDRLQNWIAADPELQKWLLLQSLLRTETGENKLWELALTPTRRDGGTLLRTALERRLDSFYYIAKSPDEKPKATGGVVREDHTLPAGRGNGD